MPRKTIIPKPVKLAESIRPVRLELRFSMTEDGDALPYEVIVTAQELDADGSILAAKSARFVVDEQDAGPVALPPNVKAGLTALTNFSIDQYAQQQGHTLA